MKLKDNHSHKQMIKDLLAFPHLLLASSLLTLAQVILTVYLPILIGRAINLLLESGIDKSLIRLLWTMFIIISINSLIQWINPILYNRLVYRYIADLRLRVFQKIHHLSISDLNCISIGDLVSRVTTDCEQLANGLLLSFNQFLLGLLTIFLTLLSMARINLVMMGLVLILTPLSLVLAGAISSRSYTYFGQQTRTRGQQTQLIEEYIAQESLIQAFNAQEQALHHFKTSNQSYANASQAATFYSSTVNPSTRFVNALIYALLTGVGAWRIMSGQLSIGTLVTFLNYITQYTKPFNDISSVLAELQSALACGDRLYDILEKSDLSETGQNDVDWTDLKGDMAFKALSFSYQADQPLMTDVNISVPAGSKVAIVGPTGAGKSTLINLLLGFYDPQSGSILLDGHPITSYRRASLREGIGMVLQETWLKEASIHDNIAYGKPKATRQEVIKAAKAAKADFFIKQLPDGYDTVLTDGGSNLSQGQRQLLTIARVFLKDPSILILDEATSSIDTRTELLIQKAFNKLMADKTSFIIAHRLSTIKTADLILVMVNGGIVEQGNHDQLMALKGVYFNMQNAQT
ncbi:ABC transporter ATP-binding protein [Streptococcus iniae]|uniref:ABC transporter ATP-binding protein n=1 Tax=Streptococcus iniae TaxID=1346 RepID=A0A3L8IFU9_STRIN|nr:ABC transporter ATP-binding protein [Streptococcus iniae]AJG25704.1 sugar ABC transporter ATP-binding protein [Streptococcus iniae]ASL34515.1 ABC transporter ATP-binding protein/permease [Streptococcus iniae]ATX39477.1 putative ABC transporter ATP-binding protein [Streptococcus iniae]EKB52455.1 ABC superfamily ATP binding cassette transporter, membrane protein [Streptococcus iniae 9117]ELY5747396.1 ABC transporter ATP-binding protein [Streptococcus iniae]